MNNINTRKIEYTKHDEIIFSFNNEYFTVSQGYITRDGVTKIYPFEIEDLSKLYNLNRFPERTRRKAKIKRTFNYFGNIFIVIAYKYLVSTNFAKKSPIYISNELAKYIDIPVGTFKTKISQLKSYVNTNEKTCPTDLIKVYLTYQHVTYSAFEEVFKDRHKTLHHMKEAFEDLLKYYQSQYKYEFKFINSFSV